MTGSSQINTSKRLYKHLMKLVKRLPEEAQFYYKNNIRQQFMSHIDETDPERIKEIIKKASEDAKYIMKKYKINEEKTDS